MLKLPWGSTRVLIVAQIVLSLTLQTAFCESEMEREENIPRPSGSTAAPEPSVSPITPGAYNDNAPSGALSSRNQGEQVLLGHVGDEKREVSSIRGDQGPSSQGTFTHAFNGDLNSRRGRVQGMESGLTGTTLRAEVPMAEMLSYGTTLTSITQGRGSFRMEMDHYDVVPPPLAEKILATAKQPHRDELED